MRNGDPGQRTDDSCSSSNTNVVVDGGGESLSWILYLRLDSELFILQSYYLGGS